MANHESLLPMQKGMKKLQSFQKRWQTACSGTLTWKDVKSDTPYIPWITMLMYMKKLPSLQCLECMYIYLVNQSLSLNGKEGGTTKIGTTYNTEPTSKSGNKPNATLDSVLNKLKVLRRSVQCWDGSWRMFRTLTKVSASWFQTHQSLFISFRIMIKVFVIWFQISSFSIHLF